MKLPIGIPHSTGRYCRFYSAQAGDRFNLDKPYPIPPDKGELGRGLIIKIDIVHLFHLKIT